MVAVIDYGAGNLLSVKNALHALRVNCVITRDRDEILSADRVILPGVGSFGDAMNAIQGRVLCGGRQVSRNLVNTIYDVISCGRPFMGICLGLQLLFEQSEESPGVSGLGIFKGTIVRFPEMPGLKVPHVGWNSLERTKAGSLLEDMENAYVYFVHSYYLRSQDENIVASYTDYGVSFHSAVAQKQIFACQFHPEKSGRVGLYILKKFVDQTC